MQKEILRRTLTDPETGLPNRRYFQLEVERVAARAERYHFAVGILTIACRGCRLSVLQQFCRIVGESVRRADCLARTAPEELQVLVTHEDSHHLAVIAERLRMAALEFREAGLEIEIDWRVESDVHRLASDSSFA